MSPGSGVLGTSAAAAVNQFVSSLTPSQREAVKAGVNPLDAAAMMKFSAMLNPDAGNFARLAGRDAAASGARYDGMGPQGFTQTQIQARDLAIKSGLSWAANNPDLLRLGPSAIQALADVHLQKESYERFKQGGLTDKGIVHGARWAKRNGIDFNQYSRTYESTQTLLAPADQQANSQAVERFFKVMGEENAPTPAQEEAAKTEFNQSMEQIKGRNRNNPAALKAIEDQQKAMKTLKKEDRAATVRATTAENAAATATRSANTVVAAAATETAAATNDMIDFNSSLTAPGSPAPTQRAEAPASPAPVKNTDPKEPDRVAPAVNQTASNTSAKAAPAAQQTASAAPQKSDPPKAKAPTLGA